VQDLLRVAWQRAWPQAESFSSLSQTYKSNPASIGFTSLEWDEARTKRQLDFQLVAK